MNLIPMSDIPQRMRNWKLPAYRPALRTISPSRVLRGAYVYIVISERDAPVKIGITEKPSARLSALRTSHPGNLNFAVLELCESREYAAWVELELHAQLNFARFNGEWFSYDSVYPYIYGCQHSGLKLIDFVGDQDRVDCVLS